MTYWNNKSVLVTGGSAGLGLAVARHFAQAGARVAIAGRDAGRLQVAAESLAAFAANAVEAIPTDVTRQDDVERMVAQAIGRFGELDALVNCAGRSARGAIADTTPQQFQELLDVNFLSAVRCTRAALPHLLASKGHVVQIGSLAARVAPRHLGAYPASKFPLVAYSQQLRLELGSQGLHVLLVCPGPLRRGDSGQRYEEQAASLPDSARQPGGGAKVRAIDPDDLARRIALACAHRQPELVVPGKARLLFAISQLWPSLGDRLLLRMTGGK